MASELQKTRAVLGGGVLGGVLLAVVGWLMLVHPKLSDASSLRSQAGDARQQNIVLAHKVAALRTASENLNSLVAQLQAEHSALPATDAMAELNDQLAGYATASRIKITSVTAGAPQAFIGAPAAALQPSSQSTSTAAPSSTPGGTSTAAAGRLYSIVVTLVSTGSGDDQVRFLHAVQYGARAALVTASAIVPEASSSVTSFKASTTMTTTLWVFVQPLTPAAQAQLLQQLGENSG